MHNRESQTATKIAIKKSGKDHKRSLLLIKERMLQPGCKKADMEFFCGLYMVLRL